MTKTKYILERCCTTPLEVETARENGASRAELCTNLEVGGVTPSEESIAEAVATKLPVNVLVRPRSGSFVYSEDEVCKMLGDIENCARLGVAGVVVGALEPDGEIDMQTCRRLIKAAKSQGLSATFHRAFDECCSPFVALEQIVELGFDRILTSGQKASALEGTDLLRELVRRADGRIIIMPGGGVSPENIKLLHEIVGATEFHGTRLCC